MVFFVFIQNINKLVYKQTVGLGLYSLHMSHIKDARAIYVLREVKFALYTGLN